MSNNKSSSQPQFLFVQSPGSEVQVFGCLEEIITLGRSPDCTIHLPYKDVSRIHAKISYHEHQYYLQDLGSKNGTFLNSRLILPKKDLPLSIHDCIQISRTLIWFSDKPVLDDHLPRFAASENQLFETIFSQSPSNSSEQKIMAVMRFSQEIDSILSLDKVQESFQRAASSLLRSQRISVFDQEALLKKRGFLKAYRKKHP